MKNRLKAMKMIHSSVSKLELLINDIFDVYKTRYWKIKIK